MKERMCCWLCRYVVRAQPQEAAFKPPPSRLRQTHWPRQVGGRRDSSLAALESRKASLSDSISAFAFSQSESAQARTDSCSHHKSPAIVSEAFTPSCIDTLLLYSPVGLDLKPTKWAPETAQSRHQAPRTPTLLTFFHP